MTPLPLQATSFVRNLLTSLVGETIAGAVAPILVFVVAFVAVYIVGRTVSLTVLKRVFDARGLDAHARKPLKKITNVVVAFVAIAVAFGLAEYGNFLQSLATIAAAATLAVGLATQDTISNFVAGVFIVQDRNFTIGDWIEWDDKAGFIDDIGFRVTRVRTFDNETITVPNTVLATTPVTNRMSNETLRISYTVGIGYADDIDASTRILLDVAAEHDEILADPEPSVRVADLGETAVSLQARFWISDPDREEFSETRSAYIRRVKNRFETAGIDLSTTSQHDLSGELTVEESPRSANADE